MLYAAICALTLAPAMPPPPSDYAEILPGDPTVTRGTGWSMAPDAWWHRGGPTAETSLLVLEVDTRDFDFVVDIEADSDVALLAFPAASPLEMPGMNPSEPWTLWESYAAVLGRSGRDVAALRVFGTDVATTEFEFEGRHRVRFVRRADRFWVGIDGVQVLVADVAASPLKPESQVDRLAVLGGFGGRQRVYGMWLRTDPAES